MTGKTAGETAFDELATEARDPSATDLDLRSTDELVRLMNGEDSVVPAAVALARTSIVEAIDAVAGRGSHHGGRPLG